MLFTVRNTLQQDFDKLADELDMFIITGGDDSTLRRTVETKLAAKVKILSDATTLSGKLIKQYAENNPNLVIPLRAPINNNQGKGDPYLDFVAL